MSEVATLSTDLPTITAEINAYKRVAGEAIFEIGRRLKHVKETKLTESHGGWTVWLRQIEMSSSQADRFLKIAERLGDTKFPTSGSISMGILDEISRLPSDIDRTSFVSSLHTVPSTGATKTVDEMTVRELREVKAALKVEREAREQAEARAEKAEDDYGLMCDTLEAVRAQPPRTEYVADPNISERLRKYEERYGDIDDLGRAAFATNTQDLTASVMSFSRAVRDFAKRYAYMAQYNSAIVTLDPLTAREYTEAVSALRDLVSVFPNGQYARTDVIDADYNIIEGEC